MSMFTAWAGLGLFAALVFGLSFVMKRINRESQPYRNTAIREEANRNRSNDWERHRNKK